MGSFDEVYRSLPGNGWLSEPEARLLWRWLPRTTGTILEVGCFEGRSTKLFAMTGRQVIVVDPFAGFSTDDPTGEAARAAFTNNLRGFINVCLWPIKVEVWEPTPVGFAYLDGSHTYLGTVTQIGKALNADADVIAIHDVNDEGGGLEIRRAAEELLGPFTERVERLAVWDL